MTDKITTQRIICEGGLYTNENHLLLSERLAGSATRLINYEVSLAGGYRRIDGFTKIDADYYEVGSTACEGPVLGLVIFQNSDTSVEYLAARKDTSGATYSWWKFSSGVGWVKQTGIPITMNTTDGVNTVTRIRHEQFNFGEDNTLIVVDGVNNALLYDGTTWVDIDPGRASPAALATAGGTQALEKPHVVGVFENHLFMSGMYGSDVVVAHSAPNAAWDWTSASGAGQVLASLDVVQIKPFRENLFVFGQNAIQKITADSAGAFVINDVTRNIGCISADSVVEVGGDIMFLSPDGFRPVAGTSRIGDVEIEAISRPIQLLISSIIENKDMDDLCSVVIRNKSQVRFFYDDSAESVETSVGVIGGLRVGEAGSTKVGWEWGRLVGIKANVCTSGFVNNQEKVMHGDYDGYVYFQENGESFNGNDILSVFAPAYLDQGDTEVRKTYRTLNLFTKPEGPFTMFIGLQFDWSDPNILVPPDYEVESLGAISEYGSGVTYGSASAVYGGASSPVLRLNIQGSGWSIRPSLVTLGQSKSFSVQGYTIEFTPEGRT